MITNRRTILGVGAALPFIPSIAKPAVTPSREGYKYIIMPCLFRIEAQTKTRHENWWTVHYSWMQRSPADNPFLGPTVHVNSRTYREWLLEGDYLSHNPKIPPHISFGGAVVSGVGDPTFKKRWEDYAAREFGF